MDTIATLKKFKKSLRAFIYSYYVDYLYIKRVKYLLKRLKVEKIIKNLNNSEQILISEFWKKNTDLQIKLYWHTAFKSVNIFSTKYIPENVYYKSIEPKLNRLDHGLWDKNYYSFWFPVKQPKTLLRAINGRFYNADYMLLTRDGNKKLLESNAGEYFIKPTIESGGGRGIFKVTLKDGNFIMFGENKLFTLEQMVSLMGKDFIIQEAIIQHQAFSSIYPYSLNTIRVLTYRRPNNEVAFLQMIVKMGNNKSYLDNEGAHGISIGVNAAGRLVDFAVCTKTFQRFQGVHPYSKIKFANVEVPNYEKLISTCLKLHKERVLYQDLVSWDMAVDSNNDIVLIELNLSSQGILFFQANNGPLFGNYTEEVLQLVFSENK